MKPYTALLFGEGREDSNFVESMVEYEKFGFHSKNWNFRHDHASGGSPKTVLEKCKRSLSGKDFDRCICFIDIDKLKEEHPKTWKTEMTKLEKLYSDIIIFWQYDCLEDEIRNVLGEKKLGKTRLNEYARKHMNLFVNSDYWLRLLNIIRQSEKGMK